MEVAQYKLAIRSTGETNIQLSTNRNEEKRGDSRNKEILRFKLRRRGTVKMEKKGRQILQASVKGKDRKSFWLTSNGFSRQEKAND